MSKPNIAVAMNSDDLSFIIESISQNVPTEDHMNKTEIETANKIRAAQDRLRRKVSKL